MPLLSIVIANYNYGRFLEEAIQSVLSQIGDGKDQVRPGEVELIIIDGGSTDNSVDVIKEYAGGLPAGVEKVMGEGEQRNSKIFYWVSEPDKGQSNAFNKGFEKARGKYLTWLNADDVLVKGCLNKVLSQMKKYPECEWFTGNFYRFIQGTGRVCEVGWGPHVYPKCVQRKNSPIVSFGPSTIFSRELWLRIGKIDESMHFQMDTDLWRRFIVAGVKQCRIRSFIWAFRMHESSKTAEFGKHKLDESRIRRFNEERYRSLVRTGHKASSFWWITLLMLRLFDGSLLRRYYYIRTMVGRSVEVIDGK